MTSSGPDPEGPQQAKRRGDRAPGVCVDGYSWKAKDVGRRFEELERLLAEIRRERSSWDQERYDEQCAAWAGKLSETWERVLHLDRPASL